MALVPRKRDDLDLFARDFDDFFRWPRDLWEDRLLPQLRGAAADVYVNGDWVHWLVWNIDPVTEEILENSVTVESREGTNSAEHVGYKGPCPPQGTGTHRYVFELYALAEVLDLPPKTTRKELEAAIQGRILAKTELTGLYQSGGGV